MIADKEVGAVRLERIHNGQQLTLHHQRPVISRKQLKDDEYRLRAVQQTAEYLVKTERFGVWGAVSELGTGQVEQQEQSTVGRKAYSLLQSYLVKGKEQSHTQIPSTRGSQHLICSTFPTTLRPRPPTTQPP